MRGPKRPPSYHQLGQGAAAHLPLFSQVSSLPAAPTLGIAFTQLDRRPSGRIRMQMRSCSCSQRNSSCTIVPGSETLSNKRRHLFSCCCWLLTQPFLSKCGVLTGPTNHVHVFRRHVEAKPGFPRPFLWPPPTLLRK